MTVDKAEVQAMINATVAPLAREQKRQRKHIAAMEKRVDDVEEKTEAALKVGELVEQVLTQSVARIELKLDKQHADLVQRMSAAEGWIGGRRRMEKTLWRLSQLAVVAALRRIFPFAALWLVLVVTWVMMVKAIGG